MPPKASAWSRSNHLPLLSTDLAPQHMQRVRREPASLVERAAALHGAAFARHLHELTWQQCDKCVQKLREGAELLPADVRSRAPHHEAKVPPATAITGGAKNET